MAFSDNFDRANENLSASANWTVVTGAADAAVISGNQLAVNTTQSAGLIVCPDQGSADHYVEYTLQEAFTYSYVAIRATDGDNFIGVRGWDNAYDIDKYVAGVPTYELGTWASAPQVGDVVRLQAEGDTIKVLVNGTERISITEAFNNTETRQGVVPITSSPNPWIDSFSADALAAATPTVTDVDAMAHGSSSNVTVSNFAAAATTGNSTLTSGTVVLTPSSVAGSVLTFPISRLDLQEGSYTWTLDIAGETASTGSVAYTIDGNGTDEFYGTVTDQAAWIANGYTEVVDGDNIYAIRTSGTTTPVLASCSFTGPSTWDIYIQDVADNVWGSSGTLTVPAAPSPSFLPSFARFNNQLIGGM